MNAIMEKDFNLELSKQITTTCDHHPPTNHTNDAHFPKLRMAWCQTPNQISMVHCKHTREHIRRRHANDKWHLQCNDEHTDGLWVHTWKVRWTQTRHTSMETQPDVMPTHPKDEWNEPKVHHPSMQVSGWASHMKLLKIPWRKRSKKDNIRKLSLRNHDTQTMLSETTSKSRKKEKKAEHPTVPQSISQVTNCWKRLQLPVTHQLSSSADWAETMEPVCQWENINQKPKAKSSGLSWFATQPNQSWWRRCCNKLQKRELSVTKTKQQNRPFRG